MATWSKTFPVKFTEMMRVALRGISTIVDAPMREWQKEIAVWIRESDRLSAREEAGHAVSDEEWADLNSRRPEHPEVPRWDPSYDKSTLTMTHRQSVIVVTGEHGSASDKRTVVTIIDPDPAILEQCVALFCRALTAPLPDENSSPSEVEPEKDEEEIPPPVLVRPSIRRS